MVPIYFPHTFIPETVMEAVQTCFSPFAVYQPSQRDVPPSMIEWQQKGWIEMHGPPKSDDGKLSLVLKDFSNWAALHGGDHHRGFDYFRSRLGQVPFFDENSVTRIRADIKRGAPLNDTPAGGSRFFGARVFLSIAQQMDAAADSLSTDLRRHEEFEKKLFSELTGDAKPAPPISGPAVTDTGAHMDHMIQERLMAWWLFVSGIAEQTERCLPGIYVTTNRPALDSLIDLTTDAVKIITLEDIPVVGWNAGAFKAWRHEILDRLLLLMQADSALEMITGIDWPAVPEKDNMTTHLTLSLYLISGQSPGTFFNHTIIQTDSSAHDQWPAVQPKSTVLALIDI